MLKKKLLIVLTALVLFLGFPACGRRNTADAIEEDNPAQRLIPEDIFHVVYHEHVNVVTQPPHYSFMIYNDIVIITVYNSNDAIMQLSAGDTFAFEPTDENPGGMSGHVINISHEDVTVITAQIPESPEDIFYEFHISGANNLMDLDADISIPDEFPDSLYSGTIEFSRNPTTLLEWAFHNTVINDDENNHALTLDGYFRIYRMSLYHDIGLAGIRRLELDVKATANLRAEAMTSVTLNFATMRMLKFGILIEIPIGLRISGSAVAELTIGVDASIRINDEESVITGGIDYSVNFGFSQVEVTMNIQPTFRIVIIPLIRFVGDTGVGFDTTLATMRQCPESQCFVVGLYPILRLQLDSGFGLPKILLAADTRRGADGRPEERRWTYLRFTPWNAFPTTPTTYFFNYDGSWSVRICPHTDPHPPNPGLLGVWMGTRPIRGNFGAGTYEIGSIYMYVFHTGFRHRARVDVYDGDMLMMSYYADVSLCNDTGAFHMRGTRAIYPDGGPPWFARFTGELRGNAIQGDNFGDRPDGTFERLGPFIIWRR